MRYTDKTHNLILPELHNFIESKNQSIYINQKTSEALDKLGQLEDLMDKYGIKNISMVEAAFISFITDFDEEGRNYFGEIESIEDEFGINLITLINIFDKGFYAWVKDVDHDEPYIFHFRAKDIKLCIESKSLIVYKEWSESIYGEYPLSEYGKSFALTKGELKK